MIPPIKCEYLPNLFDIAFISNVFIAIINTIISSIKKKNTYINEYTIFIVLLTSFNANISLNITGNPSEHNSSITLTPNASNTTPRSANINDLSLTIFLIELMILLRLVVSTTSHPSSLNNDLANLDIETTPNTIAIAAIATLI